MPKVETTRKIEVPREIVVETGIDAEKREELLNLAERSLGYDSLYIWNANINGIIIQLRTNNPHLEDFWRENWYPAALEHTLRPHGIIYAVTGIEDTPPSVYYHAESKNGFIFNVAAYENLRSLGLGLVMDIAEGEENIHFLHGALVDVNGEGILLSGPPGSGKATHAFLLLQLERARIHSADLVYVEHLGGEKGRISTHASERKFYIHAEVSKINPRLKELFKRCKKENSNLILDPLWIGGEGKFIDTTRIKVIFFLSQEPEDIEIARRLDAKEALALFTRHPERFYNPHRLSQNPERLNAQAHFFRELLAFTACYRLNTSRPLFDVQKRIREIITSREYLIPVEEKKEEPKPEIELDLSGVKELVDGLYDQPNVSHPTPQEVRQMAEPFGTKTKFGNYNFVSTVKNRSAALTVYVGGPSVRQTRLNPKQKEILRNLPKTLEDVKEYLKKAPFVCVERTMGDNPDFNPYCTLYVSTHREEMVRLAHMVSQTLFEPDKNKKGPRFSLVYIPEWQEKDRQILVFPEIGITFVLGSDYYGEAKKGFLRLAMWHAKQKGMLGLHAGAKQINAGDKSGKIKKYGMILFGLTATGKTTHTCHNHGLTGEGESVKIIQDDVIIMHSSGGSLGTEKGFYIKTDSLDPEIQPILYSAATKADAIFENVMVDYLGNVDFRDETLTGNGRGIIQRDDLGDFRSDSINLAPAKELDKLIVAFITRRHTVAPIVSRLNPEQAAAAFMLGESIETSGSDPRRAGESVREVGTNPFIIGSEAEEGNRFYEFIKNHPDKIECYLLNTGGVGEIIEQTEDGSKVVKQKVLRVEIPEMAAIIRGIIRGTIEWQADPHFGAQVPKKIEGVDLKRFTLEQFYEPEEINQLVSQLKTERVEYLKQFPGLKLEIASTLV